MTKSTRTEPGQTIEPKLANAEFGSFCKTPVSPSAAKNRTHNVPFLTSLPIPVPQLRTGTFCVPFFRICFPAILSTYEGC